MKVTLNISEFKSKTFEDTEYPATSEETVQFIPMGKSGIHIKKENRGSFTEYCGGKVTDECIRKAKNSPSSKIRKQAIFAENARGWAKKHQEGGTILNHTPGIDTSKPDISKMFVSLDVDAPKFALNNPNLFTGVQDLSTEIELSAPTTRATTTESTNPSIPKWMTTPYSAAHEPVRSSTSVSTASTARGPATVGKFGDGISDTLKSSISEWLGVPYQLGGKGPESGQGLDCSGFVSRVLGSMGSSLHGNCRDLWAGTSRLNTQDLKPGDLVFLQGTQPGKVAQGKASHVAIVTDVSKLGEGKIGVAHSGGTGKKSSIVEWDLNKGYYSKHFLGAGRVVQNAKFGGKIDYTKAHE